MPENGPIADLVRCAIHVLGRVAVPEDKLRTVLGESSKQVRAFNLLDGSRTLTEVARKVRLDGGNLSRTADRWVKNGIAFRVGTGKDSRFLHLYPVSRARKIRRRSRGN